MFAKLSLDQYFNKLKGNMIYMYLFILKVTNNKYKLIGLTTTNRFYLNSQLGRCIFNLGFQN